MTHTHYESREVLMTSSTVPPAVGMAPATELRIFGASPFHTDSELLALAFNG